MGRYQYTVNINGGTKQGGYVYRFGKTEISLCIAKNKASLVFEMTVKKNHEDFITGSFALFNDAYRKVFLVHAVKYSSCIDVKALEIDIDGDINIYNKDDVGFPFVSSMISKDLKLSQEWNVIIDDILYSTKSKQKDDLRFSAAFSYIAAMSRTYNIDRFTNLWTSMNCYYNYLCKCYVNRIDIENKTGRKNKSLNTKHEREKIELMTILIDPYYHRLNLSKEEIENLPWKKHFAAERALTKIRENEFENLFQYAESFGDQIPRSDQYSTLSLYASQCGRSLQSFLLLCYPYHLRCKYFHGEYTLPLVVTNDDYEIHVLDLVNYGLQRFLNKAIPEMFSENFWTEEKQNTIQKFRNR